MIRLVYVVLAIYTSQNRPTWFLCVDSAEMEPPRRFQLFLAGSIQGRVGGRTACKRKVFSNIVPIVVQLIIVTPESAVKLATGLEGTSFSPFVLQAKYSPGVPTRSANHRSSNPANTALRYLL